jgi:flagellar M-ring protein FliF
MEKYQAQVLGFLRALSTRQKAMLAASAVVVGLAIWFFVRLMAGGDYKPLFVGLSPADAQNLGQKLATQNISYELSTDGTSVLVPADQLDKARVGVASQGPLSSGRMGFELFDKPNWSGSDFSEKVNYQRALEAELERTIQTMSGVEAVRVHLVLPHESLFTDRERPAKAAVVLKLRGQRMSGEIGASIANLVSSAWDDLSPQNVTVVTTDGQMPGASHGGYGNVEMSSTSGDLETVMAEKVVQVLTPIVGPDHVRSSVSIEYDPTSGESTQDSYDPNTTVVLTSQTSQENSNDIAPAGIPGTPSNAPNTPPEGASANQNSTNGTSEGIRSENKTFAVSHTTHHLVEPPGRIKRVAAAILVDDAVDTKMTDGKPVETRRKRTPEELRQIEELSKAALGWDSGRGDQISVQEVTFKTPEVENLGPANLPEKIRVVALKWIDLIRYAAILVLFAFVYLLLLKPVVKSATAALQAAETNLASAQPVQALGEGQAPAQFAGSASAAGLPAAGPTLTKEMEHAVALKQAIVTNVQKAPQDASRLVQNWMQGT